MLLLILQRLYLSNFVHNLLSDWLWAPILYILNFFGRVTMDSFHACIVHRYSNKFCGERGKTSSLTTKNQRTMGKKF